MVNRLPAESHRKAPVQASLANKLLNRGADFLVAAPEDRRIPYGISITRAEND